MEKKRENTPPPPPPQKKHKKTTHKKTLHSQQNEDYFRSAPIAIFCLVIEAKGQTFRGIAGFYSTSGVLDYTAMIFSAHLVAVKCEVFITTSTRETQLCARPATQMTRCPHTSGKSIPMREDLSERGLLKG